MGQVVGDLARLVTVVAEDEEDGLLSPSSAIWSRTFFQRSMPVTRRFLYFSRRRGPRPDQLLGVAGLLVTHDDALEHRLLHDAVADRLREPVVHRSVAEQLARAELEVS